MNALGGDEEALGKFLVDKACEFNQRCAERCDKHGRPEAYAGFSVNRPLLESAILSSFQSFGGSPCYSSIYDRAVVMMHHVIRNHPFRDGNKRAALHICLYYLACNGIWLEPPSAEDGRDLVLYIADSNADLETIIEVVGDAFIRWEKR